MEIIQAKIGGVPRAKISLDEIMAAVQEDNMTGFCLFCGAENSPVEPDARKALCESCGKRYVYGAEQILLMSLA